MSPRDRERVSRAIESIARQLSPEYVRVIHRFARNWDDEPAVFLNIVLSDELPEEKRFPATQYASDLLRSVIIQETDEFAYFSFRIESECNGVDAAEWA